MNKIETRESLPIALKPIGHVSCPIEDPWRMPIKGIEAKIVIRREYSEGLKNISANSHLWIVSWMDKAARDRLVSSPRKIDPNAGVFGVFSLRTPIRPNPIGLSSVRLVGVEENVLTVAGLDVVDNTPVLDIKPYYEKDTVFSPTTPYIRPKEEKERRELFREVAVKHHQEACKDLEIAVSMAVAAEERAGQLFAEDLVIHVKGSPCLGDALQSITRARLANPPRFSFKECHSEYEVTWRKGTRSFLTLCSDPALWNLRDQFTVIELSLSQLEAR